MRARELMSTPVVTVRPEASLKELAELMVAHGISGVPVVDRERTLLGVVSESDVMQKIERADAEAIETGLPRLLTVLAKALDGLPKVTARSVADLMTKRVVSAGPDATVQELVHLMITYNVNRIPIVKTGRVVGIVTRADILRTLVRPDAAIAADSPGGSHTSCGSTRTPSRSPAAAAHHDDRRDRGHARRCPTGAAVGREDGGRRRRGRPGSPVRDRRAPDPGPYRKPALSGGFPAPRNRFRARPSIRRPPDAGASLRW